MVVRICMTGRRYDEGEVLPSELELSEHATVADAIEALRDQAGSLIHDSMLVLVDGKHLGTVARHKTVPLTDGSELELLAPVAGG